MGGSIHGSGETSGSIPDVAYMIKLWLDDERDPTQAFIQSNFGADGDEIWVKTALQAIARLRQGDIEYISLDHDLGSGCGTGMDVARFIAEEAFYGRIDRIVWSVHSMNIVGRKSMAQTMMKADEYWTRDGK